MDGFRFDIFQMKVCALNNNIDNILFILAKLLKILLGIRFRRHAAAAALLEPVQSVHQHKSEECQEKNDRIIDDSSVLTDEIKVRINPPGLTTDQVEDEGTEPHPNCVNCHEKERLEYFDKVDVETIIYGDLAEHKNDGKDVDGNIQEDGQGPQFDCSLEGVLLDCRVQDGPINDDDNDVKNEAARVKELEEPEVPGRSPISLSSQVRRGEPGEPVGVPGVEGKVAGEEESADVSEKEEELDGTLV